MIWWLPMIHTNAEGRSQWQFVCFIIKHILMCILFFCCCVFHQINRIYYLKVISNMTFNCQLPHWYTMVTNYIKIISVHLPPLGMTINDNCLFNFTWWPLAFSFRYSRLSLIRMYLHLRSWLNAVFIIIIIIIIIVVVVNSSVELRVPGDRLYGWWCGHQLPINNDNHLNINIYFT